MSEEKPMDNSKHSRPFDLEQVFFDPGSVFSSPEEVLAQEALTDEQKVEVLRRWEYDASEGAVAEEEGMPGPDTETLHQILWVLHRLTGGVDVEHTGPTKHRSLPCVSQKRGWERPRLAPGRGIRAQVVHTGTRLAGFF